ncbi:nucleoside phosphorylase domain-containing protein [Chytridium lagenaria]|nr:nucleoside phosphorylase domain-containing protein [Chytridium lagenaria]
MAFTGQVKWSLQPEGLKSLPRSTLRPPGASPLIRSPSPRPPPASKSPPAPTLPPSSPSASKPSLRFSAVGSLREEIAPRDFILPDQIIDRTKGLRPSSFFENGLVAHTGFADPFDAPLAELIAASAAATVPDVKFHRGKTLVCMEGPHFSTRAESHLYRSWGSDIINMSAVPESKLAREAEIAYQMVCMSTDYDCWRVGEEAVDVQSVMATMTNNVVTAKNLLVDLIPRLATALSEEKLASEKRNVEAVKKLDFILPGYF